MGSPDTSKYVLKRLKNTDRINRFDNEIKSRLKANIAYVPKIIDHNIYCESPYLVEEYIDGGDLSHNRHLFDGNIAKTLQYFIQVCEIVRAAHYESPCIVHRDLKPQNILYSKNDDHLYITDFGICYGINSQKQERDTLFNEPVGSRNYIAPELQDGLSNEIMPQNDIYSLGKLLYWMFTNREPARENFRAPNFNLVRLFGKQMERINRVLDKMITLKPLDRYDSIEILIEDIKLIIPLIEEGYNVVGFKLPQKCIYCGIGVYERQGFWTPYKGGTAEDGESSLNEIGFKPYLPRNWHVFICNHCGNIQYFGTKVENRSWEK